MMETNNSHELHNVMNGNEKKMYDATGNKTVDVSTSKEQDGIKIKLDQSDEKCLIKSDDTSTQCTINKWRRSAVVVSWISIFVTLAIAIIEFVVAKNENSAAAFGLAFSSLLDMLSSIVVLWRYYHAYETFSYRREHISCTVLGSVFIISSIGISVRAILGLLDGVSPDMSEKGLTMLVATSIFATCACFILFVVKVLIAKKLDSWTVFTDALNSLAGAVVALSMVITSELTDVDRYLWFLDSTVGLIVSLFLLIYGLWLLSKHAPEIYKSSAYCESK
nr:transmembrane protein 163-like [Ciona intestinalis]|eukprot:XP_009859685.1 transmembrane protein 163-like [Ciona intestinalis]